MANNKSEATSQMKKYIFLIIFFFFAGHTEASEQILYIPLDDRPVCLDYTVDTLKAAGWEVKTPPSEYIASYNREGDADQLFAWLESNAPFASAAVVASDSLIYGGLVQSRTHQLSEAVLADRTTRLLEFKEKYGSMSLYVFTTVMRSPKASSAPVEPAYYQQYGSKIFRLGALLDKSEVAKLSWMESLEKRNLSKIIPEAVLADLYSRRNKNLAVTKRLLAGTDNGSFDYLLLGRDDTATYSDAHRDARKLTVINDQLTQRKARFFAGADQLGLVLLTRAVNKIKGTVPIVSTFYTKGAGGNTIPAYEDDNVKTTVRSQILAAGGWPATSNKYADLVMAINTPEDGNTWQADDNRNSKEKDDARKRFLQTVKSYLGKKKKVAVADVAYANGSDNALVNGLFENDLAWRLAAYAGWNTAGNTIGFALAQGLMEPRLAHEAKNDLLMIRYLDEWAYQANVRGELRKEVVWPRKWQEGAFSPEQKTLLETMLASKVREFVSVYLPRETLSKWNFSLPWNRTFEVKVEKR